MDFNIILHKCWVWQYLEPARLKVKVIVTILEKKIVIALAPTFFDGF